MFEKFTAAVTGFLASSEKLESSMSDAPVPNYEYPGDYCCTIFNDHDFKTGLGYATLCIPEAAPETTSFRLSDYDMDDKNSSWACGKKVWAEFCSELDCTPYYGDYIQ